MKGCLSKCRQVMTVLAIGAVMVACGVLPGTASIAEARSDVPRDTSPDVSGADLRELVDGSNAFAFEFYQAIQGEEGNIVYSPYSISLALAMTYAGARGETEQQMADALHFTLPQERLHPAFNAVDLALPSEEEGGGDFQLNIANALWGHEDYPFAADFLDLLAANYSAGMRVMNFQRAPGASHRIINQWVAEQTEDRIRDLIPAGAIDSSTRLVLTNAIYFYADWLYPFPSDRTTSNHPFTLLDGSRVSVSMMNQVEPQRLGYAVGEGYQAVEMPYEGNEIAMVILLPDEGQFEAFEAGLDAVQFAEIRGELGNGWVFLSMPRFEFETPSISLKDILSDLGMPIAFGGGADFSGMVDAEGNPGLFIGDVFHRAFIRVDEEGTEAGAATASFVEEALWIVPTVVVDRPFFFAIVDRPTGTILFMGRVVDPR